MVATYLKRFKKQELITLLAVSLMMPGIALAQGDAGGGIGLICWVAQYLKQIVGAAALVAVCMWALEHIGGMSKLHDLVIKVGISCGVVAVGAVFIAKSGLQTCTGI